MAPTVGPGGGSARIGHEARSSKSSSGMQRSSINVNGSGTKKSVKAGSGINRLMKGRSTMPTNLGGFTQHPQNMFSGANPRNLRG